MAKSEQYRAEMLDFYSSQAWKACREAYKKKQCYICERCGHIGKKMVVHHKIHLTPTLALDPSIALNFDNLELLCMNCHNAEHFAIKKRYVVDEFGRVTPLIETR